MAITELIFPAMKTDKASIEEIERNQPLFAKKLTDPNPGLLSAFRGWILYEDDQNVRDAYKEISIFEWQDETSFRTFLRSDQFAAFIGTVQHLLAGQPALQLYETNISPKDAAVAPVVEIIRVNLTDAESSKKAEQVWERMSQFLTEGHEPRTALTYGKSLNLEECVIVGILGWASVEQRSKTSQESAFTEGLTSLRSLGEVSQIIVDIAAIALPAL